MKRIALMLLCAAMFASMAGCSRAEEQNETFDAVILEINQNSVWTAVDEASPLYASADQVVFSCEGLEDIGAEPGDLVTVTFPGMVMESYHAQVGALSWAMKEKGHGIPEGVAMDLGEPAAGAPDDAGDEFTALIARISAEYYPGTAGCSLNAAKFAAMLLDLQAESGLDAAQLTNLTQGFYETLASEQAAELAAKLDDVQSAAMQLTDSSAAGLLESAGYQAAAFPYDAAEAEVLFNAVFKGIK